MSYRASAVGLLSEIHKGVGLRPSAKQLLNGELAACCTERGIDRAALESAGIGQPLN